MTETALRSRSAFEGFAVSGRYGRLVGKPGVVCSELIEAGLAFVTSRRGKRKELAKALAAEAGIIMPERPRIASNGDGSLRLVGVGPDRLLAVATPIPTGGMEGLLEPSCTGRAALVDVSHGLGIVSLSGAAVRETLAKGTGVDLHPRAFVPGTAATTAIAHIAIHLWLREDGSAFELAIPRSFAGSFWQWLREASAPVGLDVVKADG